MSALSQFFILIAVLVPAVLVVWYVFSTIGRITRGVEDIAITLGRIEQNERRIGNS